MPIDIRRELGIHELRRRFLPYTREAFARIPKRKRPRILDIGCGRGTSTLALARLSNAEVVGFDIDETAVNELKRRIEEEGLSHRVSVSVCSLFDTGFADQSFDILLEEGVLHILDFDEALAECHRLMKAGATLVSAETVRWADGHLEAFAAAGFELVERVLWPSGCWWTEYYAPLERRVNRIREKLESPEDIAALRPYEDEIAMVKADLAATDCGHFLFRSTS
ncbi:MAG: methyltransferase domain-containing protein [Deltaproteobacteria bacterium]|nr:methyltransferase domain-containing protein [Deltaproteobacteria bacterium]MBW2254656.1 methyltransferase domain-containing protein [Deltaproteobacteria bacterium]